MKMRVQVVCALLVALAFQVQAAVVLRPLIEPRYSGAEIGEWTMDHDAALAQAREGTNNVVVMFTGAWWCPHCQALETSTLTNPAWQQYAVSNRLYLVMIDNPGRSDQYWCWLRDTNYVQEVAGLTLEQGEAQITNRYDLQTAYAVPGALTNTVRDSRYLRVGYPTLIALRPDGSRLGRFSPLMTTVSMEMVVRNIGQLLAADAWDETDDYHQGATLLIPPACEDEETDGGERTLSEVDSADWFTFDADAGRQWAFAIRAVEADGANPIRVQIFDNPVGAAVAEREMPPSDLSVLTYVVPKSGRYWLKISRLQGLTRLQGYKLVYWYGIAPASVLFALPQVAVSEGAQSVTLKVNIAGASDSAEVRLAYETVDGCARAGQDYVRTAGELVWGAGPKTAKSVTIPLMTDAVWEGDEAFDVVLYAVKNCEVNRQVSACTVVIKEKTARRPGKLGFEGAHAAIVAEGSNAVFSVVRTAGADGTVTASVDHVQGTLRMPVARLVWTNSETGARTFTFACTNELGYQPDRTSALVLTPLGGASLVAATSGSVALTRRDDLVVQTLSEYATAPANQPLGLSAVRGVWFCGFCSDGERADSWLRSSIVGIMNFASLRSQLLGPGVLSFDWRLEGDGGTVQCLVGGKAIGALTNAGMRAGVALVIPAGRQTVEWVVRRGNGTTNIFAAVKSLAWYPLPQTAVPLPADKAAVIDRALTLSWQDVLAGRTCPEGVAVRYELFAGTSSGNLSKWSEQQEPLFPRVDNGEDQSRLNALIATAASKPLYWRVDSVATDAQGRRAVNVGRTAALTVLPLGSPEFVASEGGVDPAVAGGVMLPVQTVGVYGEAGPFAVANAAGGTIRVWVKNGALPAGMSVQVRDGAVWITGVPQRVGQGKADLHLTVTRYLGLQGAPSSITTPGMSVSVAWAVQALGRAAGQFNGHLVTEAGLPGYGDAAVTIKAAGGLSGRFMSGGLTYTVTVPAFGGQTEDSFFVQAVAKAGTNALAVTLTVAKDGSGALLRRDAAADSFYDLRRDNWGEAAGVARLRAYTGYYTVALPVLTKSSANAPAGSGYLTLTVKANGTVSYAGQLADGKSVSGSSVLLYGPDCCSAEDRVTFYLLAKPSGYGVGSGLYGLIFFEPGEHSDASDTRVTAGDPSGLSWVNADPKSIFGYNPTSGEVPDGIAGFTNTLDVTGGYYDKSLSLQTYYGDASLRIGSEFFAPLDFDGEQGVSGYGLISVPDQARLPVTVSGVSALALPRSVLVRNGTLVNVEESVNPWALKVMPNQATGIFTGSCTFFYQGLNGAGGQQQRTKAVTLKGVFLPVHADYQVFGDWLGFYLLPDSCRYLDAVQKPRSYPFNWSYGFSLAPYPGDGN